MNTVKRNYVLFLPVFMIGALLFISGCGAPKVKIEPIPTTANPAEQVSSLDTDMSTARKNKVNVLAPKSFAQAEEYLQKAKKGLEQKQENAKILEQVAFGRSHLKKAEEFAQVAQSAIPKAIKARGDARSAGGAAFGADYSSAEERFLGLTRAIENNDLKRARQNEKKVVTLFRSLELRAIKEKTLGEVRSLIAQAEKEGAKKIVPVLFAEVQTELQAVDTFISENPYEKEAMLKKADAVLFKAQRMVQVMRQTKKIQTMKPLEITLWVENKLYQMSKKLSAPDLRNEPFSMQFDNILASIGALESDRLFMIDKVNNLQTEIQAVKRKNQEETDAERKQNEAQVTQLTKRIATLEGQTKEEQAAKLRLEEEKRTAETRLLAEKAAAERRLEAEQRFNELYNEVQTYFEPDEAEIYKQGTKLVIRLRAIQFPVGKAIILPENYELLSKVQKAIRSFRDPEVVIEGHTDSTGSAAFNELLSQQRADAVREYLVANRTLTPEKVSAIGYGSVRPLASNKTPEGRAINRRIDVIITPKAEVAQ